ncbi:M16 family metallopeptidase [Candidatus Margulisiibacteriota bacterium]
MNPTIIHTIEKGPTLVLSPLAESQSVTIGVICKTGAIFETTTNAGISHFIEHLNFKGTKHRSAQEIVSEIDSVGGKINAYTTKEFTEYYVSILSENVDKAINILADIIQRSVYKKIDINTERQVILEEIKMYNDTPDELIHDLTIANALHGHKLGNSILGIEKSIKNISREKIVEYVERFYTPQNCIIVAAGNFDVDTMTNKITKAFAFRKHTAEKSNYPRPASITPGVVYHKKNTEQIHLCCTTKGVAYADEEKYTAALLNLILGGNMSSRLFQNIREKYGLVYSIYSYLSMFKNTGLFSMYAGTSSQNYKKVIKLITNELKKLVLTKITKQELEQAKQNYKGTMVLALETTSAKMNWIGKSYLYYEKIITLNEVCEKIDMVTTDQILNFARRIFNSKYLHTTIIGNIPKEDHIKRITI